MLSGGGLRSLELMYNSMELSNADLRIVGLSLRSNGLVVSVFACEAIGPGFDSSSDQMFFISSGTGGRNLMDPDTINCVSK